MKYQGFTVPKYLEPYFDDAIKTVHIAEATHTHETNRLRATRELADYLDVNVYEVSNQQIDNWMMFMLGLERALNAYKKVKNEEENKAKRQELEIEQTCSYCKQVDASTRVMPDSLGKMCQACRDVYESLRVDKLKTAARVKALEGLL